MRTTTGAGLGLGLNKFRSKTTTALVQPPLIPRIPKPLKNNNNNKDKKNKKSLTGVWQFRFKHHHAHQLILFRWFSQFSAPRCNFAGFFSVAWFESHLGFGCQESNPWFVWWWKWRGWKGGRGCEVLLRVVDELVEALSPLTFKAPVAFVWIFVFSTFSLLISSFWFQKTIYCFRNQSFSYSSSFCRPQMVQGSVFPLLYSPFVSLFVLFCLILHH